MSEDTTAMWRYAIGQRVRWAKDGQWVTITSRRWVERQIMAPYAEYQVESPQAGTLWAVEADLFAPPPTAEESLVTRPLSCAKDKGQMTNDTAKPKDNSAKPLGFPRLVCAYCGGFLLALLPWSGRWHRLDCPCCGRTDLRPHEVSIVHRPLSFAHDEGQMTKDNSDPAQPLDTAKPPGEGEG